MPDECGISRVERAIAGDINSFGILCERYYTAMVAVAFSVLGDHHLAEDAVQEAFAKALLNLRGLKEPGKFGAWLARICRNVASDMIKVKARNTREMIERGFPAEHRQEGSQDDLPGAVRKAIRRLPDSAREVIVLRYYDNLSYEQISSVLDIAIPANNGRLRRAKEMLANAIKREELLGQ